MPMISRHSLVEFSWSFRYKIMSSVSRDNLTASFSIWILFISFILSYWSR
jgi:hypothetical protein